VVSATDPYGRILGAPDRSLVSNATQSRLVRLCSCELTGCFKVNIPWPESASELYPPSDRRLSPNLVPTFADRGVSRKIPYGRNLGFLDRKHSSTSQMMKLPRPSSQGALPSGWKVSLTSIKMLCLSSPNLAHFCPPLCLPMLHSASLTPRLTSTAQVLDIKHTRKLASHTVCPVCSPSPPEISPI
jgi:hypothetical protein